MDCFEECPFFRLEILQLVELRGKAIVAQYQTRFARQEKAITWQTNENKEAPPEFRVVNVVYQLESPKHRGNFILNWPNQKQAMGLL